MKIIFLNREFEFDDSIQQFSLYLEQFYQYRLTLLDVLSKEEQKEKAQFYSDIFHQPVCGIVTDLLRRLEKYGIYNVTMQDFLDENGQDPDIRSHYVELSKQLKNILSYSYEEEKVALSEARARANSSITGIGFTPVCTNLIGALTYSAMGVSAVKK